MLEKIGMVWSIIDRVGKKEELCNEYLISYDEVESISYNELYVKTMYLLDNNINIIIDGKLNPIYNMTLATDRFIMNDISKKKLSEVRKAKIKSGEIEITHNKIIHQYDLNGIYINSYKSIRSAARDNNISTSTIGRFLNGSYKKGGNFLWSYEKKESLKPYKKNKRLLPGKRVKVYNTTEYYEFNKLRDCAKLFNVCEAYVGNAIKNQRQFKRKYMIQYVCPVNQ